MQKKVLLPLMLTLPVATPALANIPLGFPKDGNWIKTNITSEDWVNEELNQVNCPVGTASVSATFKNLPKGKYFVRFASGENIELAVGGKKITVGNNGAITGTNTNSESFEFDGNGDLNLTISGLDKSIGFSFKIGCIVLEVSEDVYDAVKKANEAVSQLNPASVNPDDDFQEAIDLRAKRTEFLNTATYYNGVSMTIVLNNLQEMAKANNDITEMADSQKWISLYKEYGMDQDPVAVLAAQQAWVKWVEDYDADVEEENNIWQRYLDNVATRTQLLSEQATLLADAQALQTVINDFQVVDPAQKQQYVDAIAKLITEINDYKAAIEAAYADPAGENRHDLREEITFENQKPALTEEYETLVNDFNEFAEDYKAYYDINFVQLTNLKNAYDAYVAFLKGVKGVEGYEDVYNDLVFGTGEGASFENPTATSKLGTADITYNETKEKYQIDAVTGATENYQTNLEAIEAVIKGWSTLTEEFTQLIEQQNGYMDQILANIGTWAEKINGVATEEGKIEGYMGLTVPSSMKEQFEANLKAIQDAITEYKEYTEGKYADHELLGDEYSAKLQAVTDEIDEMDAFVEPMKTIQSLLDKLDAAKTYIEKNLEGENVQGTGEGESKVVDIAGRFNSTYEGLKNAILALTVDSAKDPAVTGPIEEQIQKYEADAEAYAWNLETANTAIAAFEQAYKGEDESLLSLLNGKIFDEYNTVGNTNLATVKANYKTSWESMFGKPITEFRNALYQAVIMVNDQDSFTALKKLADDVTAASEGDMSLEKFKEQQNAFAFAGTQANKAFATTLLNNFERDLTAAVDNNVTNADKIDSNAIWDTFGAIFSKITADKTPEELGAIDQEILDALGDLQKLVDQLSDYVTTQNNYDALDAALSAISLDELIEYNNKTSLEPALSFFRDEKIGTISEDAVATSLGGRIVALDAELTAALGETQIVTDEQKKALQDKIDAIKADITATRDAIELNNTKHNSQLDKEREERAHALDVIAQIEKKGTEDGSAALDIMTGWKAELQSIIDNDIVNENVVVTNAYGKGESAAQDAEIMAVYTAIHEKIQAIEDQLNGDAYNKAVSDANALTTQDWNAAYYNKLMDEWRKAIQDFNYYYYKVDNQGWKNEIHDEIARHQDEFASHADIDELNEKVKNYIKEQNAAPHVITPEEWKEWTDKANEISKTINDRVVDLENEANGYAAEYYATLHSAAASAVGNAEAALEAAGIDPAVYLAEANGYLADAESMYDAAVNGETTLKLDNLGRQMNEIANILDKVIPSIDLQTACQTAWADEYEAAQKAISDMRAVVEAVEFCPDEVKAAYMQDFEEKAGTAEALNTEVTGVTAGLINKYAEYVETLKTLLEGMQNDVQAIQTTSDLNKENQDIYDNFVDVWSPEINDQYDALLDFCNSLGGSGDMQGTLDNIKNAIDALTAKVDAQKANLLDKNIEEECDNIKDAIANAYKTAGETEITWLLNMLTSTKIAFNDAMVNGQGSLDERLQAIGSEKTQAGIESEIHEISNELDSFEYNADDKEGFKKTARGYEDALCEIYDVLQSTWNEQAPSVGIKAGLDAIYNEIDALITEGQTALGETLESVQTEFAGKYEALKEALDAEKAAWTADGSNVIAHEPGYKRNLNDIEDNVNALTAEIAAAQKAALEQAEKIQVNNDKYTELKSQFDNLQSEFDAAKALAESYENGIADQFSYLAETIQTMLDNALEDLNTKNENVALTAESVLQNATLIESSISNYKTITTRRYAGVQFGTLSSKDNELTGLLQGHIVPAVFGEIVDALYPLRDNVSLIRGEYSTADFDRLNEIITEAKGYIENYDELISKAEANSFIVGDVNIDGEVNVLDAQSLINMIGEGVTYEDLYAENPLEACAADVLDDDKINIADVTSIIYIIQGVDFRENRVRSAKAMDAEVSANAALVLVSEENGVSRYALMLNNSVPFIAGQFDITVSGSSRVVGVTAAERAASHDVYAFETENGGARVILANMENSQISGIDGVLVYIDVEGDNKVSTENALFADENNRLHAVGNAHTSAVDTLLENAKDGIERIWDAAGRQLRGLQRGINIIRHKDGRVTKEMRK